MSTEEAVHHLATVLSMKGYTFVGLIGEGGSSKCYAVKSLKYSTIFVCKQIYLANSYICTDCEINALKELNSPNVILLYDFLIERPYVYLWLEYCPRGSILGYVHNQGPPKGTTLIGICYGLLTGLTYIHEQKYAHFDIKPGNILIDRYGRPKLADFGLSRIFKQKAKSVERAGTIEYMSPELFKEGHYDPFKVDIWALGVTFYYLASGKHPWVSKNRDDIMREISSGGIKIWPQGMSIEFKTLINVMCALDPARRPTAQQLLKMPLFKGVTTTDGYIPEAKTATDKPRQTKTQGLTTLKHITTGSCGRITQQRKISKVTDSFC